MLLLDSSPTYLILFSEMNRTSSSSSSRRKQHVRAEQLLFAASVADGEAEKYSLRPRSIAKRLEVEQKLKQERTVQPQKRTPKPKQKPAPLSKYRRKTANARERCRMKEINQAFETLRKAIPQETLAYHSESPSPSSSSSSSSSTCGSSSEKWTKITTLRLAMDYIEALTRVLEHDTNFGGLMDADFPAGFLAGLDGLGMMGVGGLHHQGGLLSSGHCPSLGSLDDGSGGSLMGSSSSGGADHDLLSDDLDSFDDIPMSCGMVPDDHCDVMASFDIFLESDGDSLHFHSELSANSPNTP